MAVTFNATQPKPIVAWVGSDGKPTQSFAQYMSALDTIVRALAQVDFGSLVNAPNDAAARAAGVAVNQLYRNGSSVHIRVV